MPIYNLYFMNSHGHIDHIETVDVATDVTAISSAREKEGPQPIEIWREHKKVHRIEAVDVDQGRMKLALDQYEEREGLLTTPQLPAAEFVAGDVR